MYSMTGYGRGEAASAAQTLAVEISSVNRKQLEIGVSLPREWQHFERRISDAVRQCARRGKISVTVQLRDAPGLPAAWDPRAVRAKLDALKALAEQNGVPFAPDAALLLSLAQLGNGGAETPTDDAVWAFLSPALEAALESFRAMRRAEGEALARDLAARIDTLDGLLSQIKTFAPDVAARYREQLLARLRASGLELDVSDERVLKEISIFADKADIAEEITRLDSHFAQFRAALKDGEPVGRRMDFLCQEINREFNTIGSKAASLDIVKCVLDAKNELERLREQVQNVE